MRSRHLTRIEPSLSAENEWTAHVHETAEATLLSQMTNSWLFGANTPGKALRPVIYAGGARQYRGHWEDVAHAGYPGLTMS